MPGISVFIKKILKNPFTRIFISISILSILFTTLPLSELWHTVQKVPFSSWIIVVIALLAAHSFGVMKWRLLVNTGADKLPIFTAFRCYFAGLFANLFLPSMTGGDVVRAGLAIKTIHEKEAIILGSFIERILDALSLVIIVFTGTLLFTTSLTYNIHRLLNGVVLVFLILLLCFAIFTYVPLPSNTPKIIFTIVNRSRYILKEFIKNPWRIPVALSMAVIMQTGLIFLINFLARKIGINLPMRIWFIVWPTTKLSAMLPVSIGGLGVREATLAVLLQQFDIGTGHSVGLGLLWESVFFAAGATGGIFYMISKKSLLQTIQNIK